MQSVLIIGYGYVGQALDAILSRNPDYAVVIHDPAKSHIADMSREYDFAFICVGTPTIIGECDDSVVRKYVESLCGEGSRVKTVVVKSTIRPSTANDLSIEFPPLVIWPEFMRQQHAVEDMRQPQMIVIGGARNEFLWNVQEFIRDVIHPGKTPIVIVTAEQASLYKYVANSFLAMKVVYMHQLQLWMDSAGYKKTDKDALLGVMAMDARLGASHLTAPGAHGYGYAGACFPKDIQAFLKETEGEFSLLASVIEHNKALRNL